MEARMEKIKTTFTEDEISDLESRWWKRIKPTCKENVEIIEQKNKEYKHYVEMTRGFNCSSLSAYFPRLVEKFGYDDAKKIGTTFQNILKDPDYCYADNFRVAIVGNKDLEEQYKLLRAEGCCGFYDKIHEIDGVKYKIGFNYGH
jgi:hypothetical protein